MNHNKAHIVISKLSTQLTEMIEHGGWTVPMPHHDAAMWMMEIKALLVRAEKKCGKVMVEVMK